MALLTEAYKLQFRESDALFWLPQVLYAQGTQTHIQALIDIKNKISISFQKLKSISKLKVFN